MIGPMVVAGVMIDSDKQKELKEIGVKDSKLLTPMQREKLFTEIRKLAVDFKIVIVQPAEIDEAVCSDESNLNDLTAEKFAAVIDSLKPEIAYVDCPSTNTKAFKEQLNSLLTHDLNMLYVENKADQNYTVVGAASILAKVTRDREIERIKRKYNIEFGSGYPADPFTKQFLEKNYNKYPIFRKSWASWKKVAVKNGQKKLDCF